MYLCMLNTFYFTIDDNDNFYYHCEHLYIKGF